MSTVREEYGMACPKCGDDSHLDVTIMTTARLTPDGTDLDEAFNRDHEWDDDSPIHCIACGWSGTVLNASIEALLPLFEGVKPS